MTLDPASFNFIQNYFIQRISSHYQVMIGYANNLLYIFAVIEVTFFGLMWALQKKSSFDQLFLKGLKICFIFFIVTNFPYLCKVILESFAQMGGMVGATKNLTDIIFNPALLWKYGYDPGVSLLKIATESYGIGLPLLYLVLGFSTLLIFGLFIIQIVLQILGFYFISFTALIALPLGVFTPTANMFTQALTNVLKAGVRVMVIIIITGIAVSVWNMYDAVKITQETNLNPILGLLFSGILFLYLARYLPRMAAHTIGRIVMREPAAVHENNVSMPNNTGSDRITDGSTTLAAATGHSNNIQASTAAASLTGGGAPAVNVSTSTSHRAPLNITSKSLRNQLVERQTASSVMDEQKQIVIVSEKQLEHIKKSLAEALKQQTDHVKTTNEECDDENWRTTH